MTGIDQSLWYQTAPSAPLARELRGTDTVDVAVIGAGALGTLFAGRLAQVVPTALIRRNTRDFPQADWVIVLDDDAFAPAYMIDQSHNLKDPIEALLQTVDNLQRAYAKALLVRRDALAGYQEANDVLMAENTLKQAYETDVSALVAEARLRSGGAIDPISAYRASGYRKEKAAERAGAAYVPPQSL